MNILVIGGGLSGVAAANLACAKGFQVTLAESKKETPFLSDLDPNVELRTGPQNLDLLDECHRIIVSPGIPFHIPLLQEALRREILIQSEVEFALHYFSGRVLGITGTNGKSTTTALCAHFLNEHGVKAIACGNIGEPVATVVMDATQDHVLVIELSSYQLASSQKLFFDHSAWLNFTEDHLAYHGNLREYFLAKLKLASFTSGKHFVFDNFSAFCSDFSVPVPKCATVLSESEVLKIKADYSETPYHDCLNAAFASQLCAALLNEDPSRFYPYIKTFKSLPHRFQKYRSPEGLLFIDDSKATNVHSTLTALHSIEGNCTLLLGGQAKGESFTDILKFKDKITKAYFFGSALPQLEQELSSLSVAGKASSLKELFELHGPALRQSPNVLFSPACASFDEFANFTERGQYFVNLMQTR